MKIKKIDLGVKETTTRAKAPTFMPRVIKKSVSQTQRDVADWKKCNQTDLIGQRSKILFVDGFIRPHFK